MMLSSNGKPFGGSTATDGPDDGDPPEEFKFSSHLCRRTTHRSTLPGYVVGVCQHEGGLPAHSSEVRVDPNISPFEI